MNHKIKNIFILLTVITVSGLGVKFVFASNSSTQEASTSQATTIEVVGKSSDTAVTTITFPEGAPSATVSAPYNDVDTDSDPQFLDASSSEPVVRLKNTSGGALDVTLEITSWTNGVAASEDYELVDTTSTNITSVSSVLSSDGNSNTVSTGESVASSGYKALYLELNLSGVANKTGTSTLTVLGETA